MRNCFGCSHALAQYCTTVIPGWSEGPDPESRDSGFASSTRPGMTSHKLTSRIPFPIPRSGLKEFAYIVHITTSHRRQETSLGSDRLRQRVVRANDRGQSLDTGP